jgi:hypothetical protein
MLKYIVSVIVAVVTCTASAYAGEMVRCVRILPGGICEVARPAPRPAVFGFRVGALNIVAPLPRPARPTVTEEVSIQAHGPKLGTAAGEFPVEGTRSGEYVDGVSNPDAARMCFANGGHLVAHFAEVMPNGQNRYHNTCEPGAITR